MSTTFNMSLEVGGGGFLFPSTPPPYLGSATVIHSCFLPGGGSQRPIQAHYRRRCAVPGLQHLVFNIAGHAPQCALHEQSFSAVAADSRRTLLLSPNAPTDTEFRYVEYHACTWSMQRTGTSR
jgi:hypothetical protein